MYINDLNNMTDLQKKEIFIFDIDGTLAESKMAISDEMAKNLATLAQNKKIALISGATFKQITQQVAKKIHAIDPSVMRNIFLLPTSGSCLYIYNDTEVRANPDVDIDSDVFTNTNTNSNTNEFVKKSTKIKQIIDIENINSWKLIYNDSFSEIEKTEILNSLDEMHSYSIQQHIYDIPQNTFGSITEDRNSQITFSALGQKAPYEVKKNWDSTGSIRIKLMDFLQKRIPQFEVRMGGSTSIDILKKGMNKAYGVHQLLKYTKINKKQAVFFGDALFEGGNDYSVISTGILCIKVSNPVDTLKYLHGI